MPQNKENHGMSGTKIHRLWCSILKRCKNNDIEIYNPWENSFSAFYNDVGDPSVDKPYFSRKDSKKGFFPGNCESTNKSPLWLIMPMN